MSNEFEPPFGCGNVDAAGGAAGHKIERPRVIIVLGPARAALDNAGAFWGLRRGRFPLTSGRYCANDAGIAPATHRAGTAPMADDELDLKTLADDELVEQMHDDLYDGLKEEIIDGVKILLDRGWAPYDVLTKALVEGMRIVGIDFRDGILFVPEVLMSANAMKAGMAILRPLLAATGAPKMGKMVIGTVKGDIHDIGKNLVCMMMEGAGFEVFDLGVNNSVEKYLEAIEKHQPEIVGMSALLTTTMPYMKVIIDTLKEKGMRNDHIVLVGGAPLNENFAEAIGADAYCRDAAVTVETAKALLARRQGTVQAHEKV
jgi:methylmalonyl-CoA mutase cobalamin-binding domain/chain